MSKNKRKGKKRGQEAWRRSLFKQFWCMWAEWAATHALLIPNKSSGSCSLLLSCLAPHSSLPAKDKSLPSSAALPRPLVNTRLDSSGLHSEKGVETYAIVWAWPIKTYRKGFESMCISRVCISSLTQLQVDAVSGCLTRWRYSVSETALFWPRWQSSQF